MMATVTYRAGDLVRIVKGPHAGKVGRIAGFTDTVPDFRGDQAVSLIVVDGDWAADVLAAERLPTRGLFRHDEIEAVTG